MSKFRIAAMLALTLAFPAGAVAQTTGNGGTMEQQSKTGAANVPTASTPGMAATTSDPGPGGTGASSAAIGTGTTDKSGVMSPMAPAAGMQGQSGANPNKTQTSTP